MQQRAIVEVRTEAHDHAHVSARTGQHLQEPLQEPVPLRPFGAGREDLLELIDHEEEGGAGSDPFECVLQLRRRTPAGDQLGDVPPLRSRDGTGPERGDQAGAHRAGLATARGSDNRDETCPRGQHPDELLDELGASEEVLGIAFLERAQALVGVADRGHRRPGSRSGQGLVVQQDPFLQATQGRGRVEAELLGEVRLEPLERPQCFGVAPQPVQAEHLELAEPLPERVLPDPSVDERERLLRAPELPRRAGEQLEGVQVEGAQVLDLGPGKLVVREVGKRRTTPQIQRLVE